ncbi:MAG: hypothetical protein HOW73_32215 [Polyangiaceae bacterium]|nr:hypothetical protein [Polyangiaceae bacterium]
MSAADGGARQSGYVINGKPGRTGTHEDTSGGLSAGADTPLLRGNGAV